MSDQFPSLCTTNPRKWFAGKDGGYWCALLPHKKVVLFSTWRQAYDYADSQARS